ncbi:hypothetical protein L1F30_12030 [Simiduia sp. 21SJ11W-1]|uniref:hypothetical protein n=1 Tax=Simiduia sp. 21SJ11W-1 TaxID=2909669 RepID=UPI00209EE886|nr:hypothetical protein [Simiduia sp. 21SJ11W-1]UTA46890.1 hypothetical protein L1F30_12030 [Simiduia sp. 21SJ11W-1]
MPFKLAPKRLRQLFLTASLTLTIWYLLLLWDLARGETLGMLQPYLADLLTIADGALVVIAGLVPLILFWGWASKVFANLALKQLAVDLKRRRIEPGQSGEHKCEKQQ